MAGGLVAFGQRVRAAVVPVMDESRGRVYAQTAALTPVGRTGHMRATLRAEADPQGFGYAVGWSPSDFPPGGKRYVYNTSAMVPAASAVPVVPAGFYPGFVIFGTRYMAARDPLTPALEAERPVLMRELAAAILRAARG